MIISHDAPPDPNKKKQTPYFGVGCELLEAGGDLLFFFFAGT
jgi:hypothetical protein